MGFVAILVVGAIAGWLAGVLIKGHGFGLVGNIAVGVAGALTASFLLPLAGLDFGGGLGAAIVHSCIGAVVLLILVHLLRKGTGAA